jgi:hypothetical protein
VDDESPIVNGTAVGPYHLKIWRGRCGKEEAMENERKVETEMVPGRCLFQGEGLVLRAKKEINHRENERVIHRHAFESPGEWLFGVRRRRERLKCIGPSVVIDQ